jgi:hypothetical protein
MGRWLVMSKLELLSANLVQTIESCVRNEDLVKLLYYNGMNPLSNTPVNPSLIAPFGEEERIFAYPFNVNFVGKEKSQLHIYYPDLKFKNNAYVEKVVVWFDIVVHKRLWLTAQDNKKIVRPYEIASLIARQFDGTIPNTKGTVGKLDFLAMGHVAVNEEFDAIRLEAIMTNY